MRGGRHRRGASGSFDGRLERKARGLIERYEATGRLDPREVAELDALRALHRLAGPPHRSRSYLNLALIALAALALSLLVLVRVPATEIELIVNSTDVGFRTVGELQPVIESLDFAEVDFNDVAEVSLSSARPVRSADGAPFPFELEVLRPPGSITLEQLFLPAGSSVYLQKPQGGTYDAAVFAETVELEFELEGAEGLGVATLSSMPERLEIADGGLLVRGVSASGAAREGDQLLRFAFEAAGTPRLAQQAQVSSLDFTRADVFSDTQNTRNALVSGIESGDLYLEELNGRELALRPGEQLRLGGVNGRLRAVELGRGGMRVQFRGTVRSLTIGFAEPAEGIVSKLVRAVSLGDAPRSLMPTLLEWLQARTSVTALLSGAVALLGALAALLEWRRS